MKEISIHVISKLVEETINTQVPFYLFISGKS